MILRADHYVYMIVRYSLQKKGGRGGLFIPKIRENTRYPIKHSPESQYSPIDCRLIVAEIDDPRCPAVYHSMFCYLIAVL